MSRRTSRKDPKVAALRKEGVLNPAPAKVRDLKFREDEFFDPRDLVQVKYEMLRRVRVDKQAITESAAAFGFSRPSFYQAQFAFEQAGLSGLIPKKPGPRRAHKLSDEVMQFVIALLSSDAALGAADLAHQVQDRFGRKVHPRSIERALARRQAEQKKKRR